MVGTMPNKDAARPGAEQISCDAAQPVVEVVATETENFASSPAEATRGESEARWNAGRAVGASPVKLDGIVLAAAIPQS
jgi:hypothetical protein